MKDNYDNYFSARGVKPDFYTKTILPTYVQKLLGNDQEIRILDIGCGFGQNIRCLKDNGYQNVQGIDITEEAVKYCRKEKLSVELINVLDYYPVEKFDFIMMNHVLEHMPKEEIIKTLAHIKENILETENKTGGIFITVPNAQSNTDCYWAYEDFTHNTLFTAGSLLFVLRQAGFQDITFIDPLGLAGSSGYKKFIKKILLKFYITNKLFWNKVTGSAYHKPSPMIFTWEVKALAK